MVTRSLKLLILSITAIALNASAADQTQPAWSLAPAAVSDEIRVESATHDGKDVEIVHITSQDSFEIESERFPEQTQEQYDIVREQTRETLELTLKSVLSDDFDGAMVIGEDGQAVSLQASVDNQKQPRKNLLKTLFTYNGGKGFQVLANIKHFSKIVWKFVFVETWYAGKKYGKHFWRIKGRIKEAGIAFDIKVEPQVFIGSYNPTQKVAWLRRSYAIYLEVGFNWQKLRFVAHTRLRKEKGAGGTGLPALKAEIKIFGSDGYEKPYRGEAWYPPIPLPIVSAVVDKSEHYFALGGAIGANMLDVVPGSFLTNTFTSYVQTQDHMDQVQRVTGREIKKAANRTAKAVDRAAHDFMGDRAPVCADLFRAI